MHVRGGRDVPLDAYIDKAKPFAQPVLIKLRELIHKACPEVVETIKWGMPAYSYKRILVCFAVFKHHIGFFPTPSAVKAFEKDLTNYKTSKGAVQFPHEKKLPASLIKKITAFRVMESELADEKWRQSWKT